MGRRPLFRADPGGWVSGVCGLGGGYVGIGKEEGHTYGITNSRKETA
jgi:hypothetical protein